MNKSKVFAQGWRNCSLKMLYLFGTLKLLGAYLDILAVELNKNVKPLGHPFSHCNYSQDEMFFNSVIKLFRDPVVPSGRINPKCLRDPKTL